MNIGLGTLTFQGTINIKTLHDPVLKRQWSMAAAYAHLKQDVEACFFTYPQTTGFQDYGTLRGCAKLGEKNKGELFCFPAGRWRPGREGLTWLWLRF